MRRREFIGLIAAAAIPSFPEQRFRKFGRLESAHFDVLRVSESVFAVRGKADSGIPTNSSIIVGEKGVAVVDTHMLPSLDREVIEIVKRITDLPIRYLINTHWHQDHTLGNQVFESFAVILGHEATKSQLTKRVVPNLELQRQVLPEQQAHARETLASIKDPTRIAQLSRQIELDDEYIKELDSIRVTAPTRTFSDTYKLDISNQPIELRHLGFGHTRGDIVIYLPQEATIILGDLVTAGQPFMRKNDAVPSAWAGTLRKIDALSWDKAVIGHGWVDVPRERLHVLAAFLDVLVDEVSRVAHLPFEKAQTAVLPELARFAPHFPYFEQAVLENILRTWEELQN